MKALITILLCSLTIFADGINKPKKKVVKRKPVAQKPAPKVEKPKMPSLLTTKEMEQVAIFTKPTLPLLDVPPLPEPLPIVVTSTKATFTFQDKKCKFCFLLLAGVVVPFLFHGDEEIPPGLPTPSVVINPVINPTAVSGVPEPATWGLFITGILLFAAIRKRKGTQ